MEIAILIFFGTIIGVMLLTIGIIIFVGKRLNKKRSRNFSGYNNNSLTIYDSSSSTGYYENSDETNSDNSSDTGGSWSDSSSDSSSSDSGSSCSSCGGGCGGGGD